MPVCDCTTYTRSVTFPACQMNAPLSALSLPIALRIKYEHCRSD